MVENEEAKPSKTKIFARRLTSASILYGILLAGLFAPNETVKLVAFGGVISILGALGLLEFYNLAEQRGYTPFKSFGVISGFGLILSVFWALAIEGNSDRALDNQISFFIGSLLMLCAFHFALPDRKERVAAILSTYAGLIYVALLLNVLQLIRYFGGKDGDGHWWVFYFIVVSKMSDTGAYCVGSLIGKHKMVPRISPGKTWEGFAGGIAFSVLASWAFFQFGPEHFQAMELKWALGLGAALGVGSVIGDLIESMMKRAADVKDSGNFLPGIGGTLDLLDSLLFNAPLMYLFLKYGLR
jgi:phosphatidate cytidylyltransferase